MRRLFRMEHAGRGSAQGRDPVRGQAQSARRGAGLPAGRAGYRYRAARADDDGDRRVGPGAGGRVRRGVGDADRGRSGDREVDAAVAGGGEASDGGAQCRLCVGGGGGGPGAAAGEAARAGAGAGAAGGGDLGPRHPDHAVERTAARAAGDRFDPDDAFRPDRRGAGHGQPGARLVAGADPFRQGPRHRTGAGRPRHQGRIDRRPARAGAYGRHRAGVRGRAQPSVSHPARDQEPVRRHRRDWCLLDADRGLERGRQPVVAVPDQSGRGGDGGDRLSGT